jgi:hypothetical protein
VTLTFEINRVLDSLKDQICTKFGQNLLKDVDPRVFTRIVTDGSVTISPRNFVGEGIIRIICPSGAIRLCFSEPNTSFNYHTLSFVLTFLYF